ncbi:hypothetical protein TrLO_g14194 [Triparma laevis f. longispina]|uniref:Dynein alpha chain, flagellar outer arm n=2 Tax=Triparma laevis TaxID=1534972 RepID=A0A9W7C610_9STRA|nr:hypothetical protein TrLO_g14194 [Triparma laevis f. longispina]
MPDVLPPPPDAPSKLAWKKAIVVAKNKKDSNMPSPRSGHSFSIVGTNAFMFGGLGDSSPPGPSNDLFILRMGSAEMEFTSLDLPGTKPPPRWRHTASVIDSNQILIFGGFASSTQRYNDAWVFNTVTMEWWQPVEKSSECVDGNHLASGWPGTPSPRGAHTSTLINKKIYVFGGYGGMGYGRRDLDDLHSLDTETWKWTKIAAKGKGPDKRSGHQATACDNSLYVFGGWNSAKQFDDMHVLDTASDPPNWTKLDSKMPNPLWNHSACGVMAIPSWKIFVFGGVSGQLSDSDELGTHSNNISMLDTGSERWSSPKINGELPPPRADTTLAYDSKGSKLIVFGGWANEWFNDIYLLDVGSVVGPPYAIMDIYPKLGPITGDTPIEITGIDFVNTADVVVRFATKKAYVDVKGVYSSQTKITCVSPDCSKFPPGPVEVRVALNNDSFTTTFQPFELFAVTDATKCLMYGPGILSGCAVNEETMFIIQARDENNNNRTSGGDEFVVTVSHLGGGEEGEDISIHGIHVQDQDDGTYVVMYTAPNPGEYEVQVEFKGTFGGAEGPVRGSGCVILFEEFVSRDNNTMAGKLVLDALKQDLNFLLEFSRKTSEGIQAKVKDETWTNEQSVNSLVSVKEHLNLIEERQEEINLVMDRSSSILAYLKAQGVNIGPMEVQLKKARSTWETTIKEVPQTQIKIAPLVKAQGSKMRGDIEIYEKGVFAYLEEVSNSPFKTFATGAFSALQLLNTAKELQEKEKKRCGEMLHLANMFDCPRDMQRSQDIIHSITELLHQYDELWLTAQEATMFIEEAQETPWVDIDPDGMEEAGREFVSKVKKLPKATKESDAFVGLDKHVKEFLKTCPLIGALRHPGMRPRHWTELMEATGTSFSMPSETPDMRLREILSLGLHKFGNEVEEITDKAVKEAKQEETLKNLKETWEGVNFISSKYKDSDVPLVKLSDDDFELLEADQLTLQGMVASRYQHFKEDSTKWQKWLVTVSEVNQILSELQRMWSYLEPLFIGSDEVKKELPADAKRFASIDAQVRQILKKCDQVKNVKTACTQSGLLAKLESLQNDQEICKKSLSDFLDGKRRLFPRFYFTSEADLLDILSNGSMPVKIMRHVDKVFLATKALELEEAPGVRPKAKCFVAGVGQETVDFEPYVPLEGKVEIYLQLVLEGQISALKKRLEKSTKNYPNMGRTDWLMHKFQGKSDDPAQISILVAAIQYVKEVEDAFMQLGKGNAAAMEDYNSLQVQQLQDLIKLTQTDLNKSDRTRVMVMITMDSHSRDVIQTLMRDKVEVVSCFQWQSQLKQTYDPSDSPQNSLTKCKVCDAEFDYGFEYLGNGPRLVITPLTDRIYVTATQALNLKMGCAPAGPAGTGKTESTKDLASALGKCCYVFNCSPEMDYQSLGNIFKGLASSGSWGCFDEFNRLIPEVLSVCSVQFKSVCDGNKQFIKDDLSTHTIVVEGDSIKLDPSNGAFITMNPGYLGRSELPEGLKALFRPMTVMTPDLVLICENMLMAEGFVSAKMLASKFYTLYSLLKDLLSKQEHYDWGLRAIKSVLVVAGAMKRSSPELQEDALLMRALRDTNTPKIVQADEVVFFGLLNDLFPGLDPQRVVNEELGNNVALACEQNGLWADPTFKLKCLQLEELLQIRHCVFVMGPAGAGKSACWKMLAGGMTIADPSNKVKVVDLNPKVLPTEDLYGHVSLQTREWKDGLLSVVMRDLGQIEDEKPKWILLDGDLDANWIESMNSVMDDNKMLTLASNERIPLKPCMRMIFEIRDLRYATPATVSRAGIIFISTDEGTQWRSLIASWVQSRPEEQYSDESRVLLQELFEKYMADAISYFNKKVEAIVPVNDITIVTSLLRLLDGLLTPDAIGNSHKLETAFVFACIWAFGSALTTADDGTEHQKEFSDWWRNQYKSVRLPTRDTIFDYWLDPVSNKFEPWKASPSFKTVQFDSRTMQMSDITVPTTETASILFWSDILVKKGCPLMLVGPAGTGKTQLISGLIRDFNPEEHLSVTVNMNFYSTAVATMTALEAPLQKRTGSTYGPPGSTQMVYFIDDLNLPEVDLYNTQSAIALVRQHLDYQHWYDPVKFSAKTVNNCQYIAAMNPTAGCFFINPRVQRHFTSFAVGMPSATSLLTIYDTFLSGHLTNNNFNGALITSAPTLIKGALAVHKEVSDTFRKTAANFHYEFNIRHLANVFAGLLVSTPANFDNAEKFCFLWLHESERVYGDRIVDSQGLLKFKDIMQQQAKKAFPQFNASKFYLAQGADPLVFCHFASGDDMQYDQCTNIEDIKYTLENALIEYNEINAVMDLVLFNDAICHIARITRIVQNTAGHAMLVGVGGSGKQSLSRLAAHICSYSVSQITISSTYGVNDLKSDLQAMYRKAGVRGEGVMFLFTDNQITNEKFLVYLNDLLASGNIPDLYTKDEQDGIINEVIGKVKAAGLSQEPDSCWRYFIGEVRKNLHCVLCFSPVGDGFRTRARKFPALVNCTVIDWFHPWPADALFSVGEKFLSQLELGSDDVRNGIAKFMPESFVTTQAVAERFMQVEGRHVHSTPKTYLEFLKLYGLLLNSKREENSGAIMRLKNGVTKLKSCAEAVTHLESNLKEMLLEAEEKREVSEGIANRVSAEKAIVEGATAEANVEKDKVEKMQVEISAQQAEAEGELAKAEPAVIAAMSALDTLDKKDLGSCKTMSKPPPGVGDIFAAVMVLLAGLSPNIVTQKNGKVKDKDRSWDASKKNLLGNVNGLVDDLKSYKEKVDNNTVPAVNWKEVRPYLAMEHFNVETIEKKNSAAAGLCSWVLNIVAYYDIVITVEPKRIALREAKEKLDKANEQLAEVQGKVKDLQERLDKLTEEYNAADKDRNDAQMTANKGKMKLELAQRLTNALGSEGSRWTAGIGDLESKKGLVVGDSLLAAAFISYVGPFTKEFRTELVKEKWVPFLKTAAKGQPIAMSEDADPLKVLTNEAEIAGWNTQGLPADPVSSENGTIVSNSSRWPLLIDPQLQGVAWIKSKEGVPERNLQVTRLGHADILQKLETSIENGWSLLIENMDENIDAVLMPVISRAVIKRGSRQIIKIGENEVEYNKDFKLFLHTKLSNPHYPPEVQAETTLVNFSVTLQGLEDQLLALVVRKERPDLASQKAALIQQENQFKVKLKGLEDQILVQLAAAEGDVTEDRELIEGLEEAKRVSTEVSQKLEEGAKTNEKINETSEAFRSVASRGSLLFFLMNDLHKIHTYYMYSLNAFVVIFQRGIQLAQEKLKGGTKSGLKGLSRLKAMAKTVIQTERFNWNNDMLKAARMPNEDDLAGMIGGLLSKKKEAAELSQMTPEVIARRCIKLKEKITETLFDYLRRGLFEKDKLTVATMLTFQIQQSEGVVNPKLINAMVQNATAEDPVPMSEEIAAFMPENLWNKLKGLEEALASGEEKVVPAFEEISDKIAADYEDWETWYNSPTPESAIFPGEIGEAMSAIEKILIIRALRPDRVSAALKQYLTETMEAKYVDQPPFDMTATYQEASASTPIFFVLFPGVDPTPLVEKLGASFDISAEKGTFVNISLGQGQEKPAENMLEKMAAEGGWIMLQNLHLMQSWLPTLDRKLEVCAETAHASFRCFISAEAPPLPTMKNIPEALLQACIKVSNEAPADLKSNLLRAWATFNQERLDGCSKTKEFRSCLFGLCFFHSLMLGRKRFGPQGWSRSYSFNIGDLSICADILTNYLNNGDPKDGVPFQDLRYLFGEIMYGGHITDFWDRRTCETYLAVTFHEGLMNSAELAPKFNSPDPVGMTFSSYTGYIERSLPAESPPLFGLHPNAEIGYLNVMADTLFGTILKISAGSAGSGASSTMQLRTTVEDLINKCPHKFDLPTIGERAKPLLTENDGPFVVVATQEATRMNALLQVIKDSLVELKKGMNGQLNMSMPMEHLAEALSIFQVPGRDPFHQASWEKSAWPSKKGLSSWFADLMMRNTELRRWTDTLATPFALWLPGLFNPTAYLTAIKQVTARAKNMPLDSMSVETHVTRMIKVEEVNALGKMPEDGAFVYGLFIEGARWMSGEEAESMQYNVSGTDCEGRLADSKLKELMPLMPILYVKARKVEPTWKPTAVGYVRDDPDCYTCPVYATSARGGTFVTVATLKCEEKTSPKWVLAGVSLLMQTDD